MKKFVITSNGDKHELVEGLGDNCYRVVSTKNSNETFIIYDSKAEVYPSGEVPKSEIKESKQ